MSGIFKYLLDKQNKQKFGDRIALKIKSICVTYSEMFEKSKKIGNILKNYYNINKGDRIILCMSNSLEFVFTFLALNYCEAIIIPFYYLGGFEEKSKIIDKTEAKYIIYNGYSITQLEEINDKCSGLLVENDTVILLNRKNEKLNDEDNQGLDDVAVIFFTSGSTGEPKGVMLTNNNIIANIKSISGYLELEENDKILLVKNLVHSSSINGELLVGLANGCEVDLLVMLPMPHKIVKFIVENNITVYFSIPILLMEMFQCDSAYKLKQSKLKIINFYGAPMSIDKFEPIFHEYQCIEFIFSYGLTEASPRVTYIKKAEMIKNRNSSGRAISGVEISCSGNDEFGEILVKGKNVMKGYYNDPIKSEKVLKNGWLHTGDYGYIKNGLLYILTRMDSMIFLYGKNIYPEQIEQIISEYKSVHEAVVRLEIDKGKEILCAYISGDIKDQEIGNLRAFMSNKIENYKIPAKFYIVSKLPKTNNGKIKRG